MNLPSVAPATPPPRATKRWGWLWWFVLFFLAAVIAPAAWIGAQLTSHGCSRSAEADFNNLFCALKTYKALYGRYPTTKQSLRALVERPTAEPRPEEWIQITYEVPKDRWGNEYLYVYPGTRNPGGFDLSSKGPDGIAGTADDLGNWQEGLRPWRAF